MSEVPRRRKEDRLPWFPFKIDRWETDIRVRTMGPATRGIFLTLLILEWREGSIPSDPLTLLRLTHMPPDPVRNIIDVNQPNTAGWQVDLEACLEQALQCFIPDGKGGLYNETLEEIRVEQEQFRDSCAERGRIGGLKRARNRSQILAELEPSYEVASSKPQANSSDLDLNKELNTKSKSKAKALSAFVIPEWVPKEAWEHYEEMRRRIRKPMTDQARKWAVALLERLSASGNEPGAVLEQSVFNSWQGLFEVRHDRNPQTGRSNREQLGTQAARAANNIGAILSAFPEMGGDSASVSSGQATRSSRRNPPLLEGEVKKIP